MYISLIYETFSKVQLNSHKQLYFVALFLKLSRTENYQGTAVANIRRISQAKEAIYIKLNAIAL